MDASDGAIAKQIYDGANKASIFIIDYGQHMHENDGYCFKMAIAALRSALNSLCCVGGSSEIVAVFFINTGKKNNVVTELDGIFIDHEIGVLYANYVQQLDQYLSDAETMAGLYEKLGDKDLCDWGDVLLTCKQTFSSKYSKRQILKKFIHIFSSQNIEPFLKEVGFISKAGYDADLIKKVETHINDLKRTKTSFTVSLIQNKDEVARPIHSFWLKFDQTAATFSSLDELSSEIQRKNYALRATTSVPFHLAAGLEMAVGVFYLITPPKSKPAYKMVDSETSKQVQCVTRFVEAQQNLPSDDLGGMDDELMDAQQEEEQACVYGDELKFARDIGGQQVVVTRQERENLRRFDKPGIKIIGFKPLSLLKPSHYMGETKYVYPLDSAVSGSSTLYRALYLRCCERKLFILARYTQKVNTTPQLVALVPQERTDPNTHLDSFLYEGFHMVRLPFAEDARNLDERLQPAQGEDWPVASVEQIDAAKGLIGKLTRKNFWPDNFSNPETQRRWKALEVLALGLDMDEFDNAAEKFNTFRAYFNDPNYEHRAVAQLERFKSLCYRDANAKMELEEELRGEDRMEDDENGEQKQSSKGQQKEKGAKRARKASAAPSAARGGGAKRGRRAEAFVEEE